MIKFEKVADHILRQLYVAGKIVSRDLILKHYVEIFYSEVDRQNFETALKYLTDQELIHHFLEPGLGPGYAITVKGLVLYKAGGISKKQFNERVKNILYIVSLIAVIIAGIYYLLATIQMIICWK